MSRMIPRPDITMRSLAVFLLLLFVPTAAIDSRDPQKTTGGTGNPPVSAREESAGGELEDFVPSEKIKADSVISFPVDI